nr:MAG TPA: hypothetical protein [Caudoviricetes sp.]DAZ10850.1 MAG TPA: hypothetical protein [Caudoviricetes sp.]
MVILFHYTIHNKNSPLFFFLYHTKQIFANIFYKILHFFSKKNILPISWEYKLVPMVVFYFFIISLLFL